MTEHRLYRLPLICLLWVVAMTASSFGQLPASIYTSADPTPQMQEIDAFVLKAAANLASPDYPAWGSARALIIGEVLRPGTTQGFLDVYAKSVNNKLMPLTGEKDARHRLNVAIIVAKIAAKANNAQLMPITEALLHDSSDAVVLWGLQSAKYVLPSLLQQPGKGVAAKKLALEIALAAKDHATPATVEEAYRALVLDPNFGTERASDAALKALAPDTIKNYLPAPITFYQYRVNLYSAAVPPEEPIADTWGSSFFIKSPVWTAAAPQQQSQILEAMVGLLKGAAKQNAAAKSPELFDLIKRTGQALDVVGTLMKGKQGSDLQKAAHNVSAVPNDIVPDDLETKIKALEDVEKDIVKTLGTAPSATAGP